jgi:predicted hydrocarbon binding protein
VTAPEKSGYYYPNKMVRIYLTAIEEMIGPEAMKAVLSQTNTPELIDNYPPDNLGRAIDFADFSAIGAALEKIYGPRGERGLGLHAGKACFNQGVSEFGSVSGVAELTFKAIPFNTKLKIGLKAMAEAFNTFSDQMTWVDENEEQFVYTIARCPVCWGRTSQKPICYIAAGIIQAGLHWFTGGREFQVDEVACLAVGDEACVFHIGKEPPS